MITLCWIKRDCPFAPLNCKHKSASPRVAVISPVQEWTMIVFFWLCDNYFVGVSQLHERLSAHGSSGTAGIM